MEKSIYYFIYSPPGSDGWKDLFHHFSEVCRGQGLDSVDGAVGAVVIIHLVLGQRHLARIYRGSVSKVHCQSRTWGSSS